MVSSFVAPDIYGKLQISLSNSQNGITKEDLNRLQIRQREQCVQNGN